MKIINRIFYIDVTDVNTTGITNYMETIKNCILETNDKSEKTSAIKEEIKENKNIIWEDYFIPVKYYDETDDHLINERQGLFYRIYDFFFRNKKTARHSLTKIEILQTEI
jgi:hypothetical protein